MKLVKKIKIVFLAVALCSVAVVSSAQDGTPNVFTPYSMYGIGSISGQGTPAMRSMGGAGIAYRSVLEINTLNPASYSMAGAKSFLLDFGMMGENNYLKNGSSKTSHNSFNLNDISMMFRVAPRLGFGITVSPFSNVGYNTSYTDKRPDVIESVGKVQYNSLGSGGFVQMKAGLGWMAFKNFSVGINYIYYLGSIDKMSETTITPILNSNYYRNTVINETQRLSHSSVELGLQYSILAGKNKSIILGAVYQPKIKTTLKNDRNAYLYENGYPIDTIFSIAGRNSFHIPGKMAFGLSYKTPKLNMMLDYESVSWKGAIEDQLSNGVRYVSTHQGRFGLEYTPNRYDLRNHLKRWTYRVGARYGNSYLNVNGVDVKEYAMSVGVGIPIQKGGFSMMNIGAEFGKQGMIKNGLVADRFIRIFLGFNLMATNEWFVKRKFQ